MPLATEILIILLLIAANGILAMTEFALVSIRKGRLRQRIEEGDTRAKVVLELAEDPNRFLSTIQIGITLVGILAGAFGGTTVAIELATWFLTYPATAPYAETLSIAIVVLMITFLTLVFGELVPKRLGLHFPERIATLFARPMKVLALFGAPVVWLISVTTDAVLRLLRVPPKTEVRITEEEIRFMLAEGRRAGVFEPAEHEMVEQVFRFGDRLVTALMTPRLDIVGLDLDSPAEENWRKIIESGHTWYPVYRETLDEIKGVISVRDLWAQVVTGKEPNLASILREPIIIPESKRALDMLEIFRNYNVHLALITDEYGSIVGLLSLHDIIEAIIGDIPTGTEKFEPEIVPREDGSWLVDASLPITDVKEKFHISSLPDEGEGYYQTLAGFVISVLGKIPKAGDHFEWSGYRFEVIDMDGRRVDKVLIVPLSNKEDHSVSLSR
jgi:putative hemolysin